MPFKFTPQQMNGMRELFDSGSVAAIITTTQTTSASMEGVASIRLLRYNEGAPCGPSVFINAGTAAVGSINEGYVFSTFATVCTMMTVWGLDIYHIGDTGEWTLFDPEKIEQALVFYHEDAIDILTVAAMARYYEDEDEDQGQTVTTQAPMSPLASVPPHRIQSVTTGMHPGVTSIAQSYKRSKKRPAQPQPYLGPPQEVLDALGKNKQPSFDENLKSAIKKKTEAYLRESSLAKARDEADALLKKNREERMALKQKDDVHNRKIQVAIDDFERFPDHEDIY